MKPVHRTAILAAQTRNPEWTHRQIAEFVGCSVRTVDYSLSAEVRANQARRNKRYLARLRTRS